MHKNLKFFLAIAFTEGAAVMAVELTGAKLIAPFFGTSLYVWASVLGVTMIGLAGGYFLGGRMSEKMDGPGPLFRMIALAAFFTSLMPVSSQWIMEATLNWDVRMGSLLSSAVFILPPMLFFGMVSPMIIRVCSLSPEKAGKVSGMVFATSTLGGILTTFLMGFYLIPAWGLRKPLWIFGAVLTLVPLVYVIGKKEWKEVLYLLLFLLPIPLYFLTQSSPLNSQANLIYKSEGLGGTLVVADELVGQDSMRTLYIDGRPQTTVYKAGNCSGHAYILKVANLLSTYPERSRVLMLGMGGGALFKVLKNQQFDLQAVELEPRMKFVSEEYFDVPIAEDEFLVDDARHVINQLEGEYAAIVLDVFFGDNMPGHLITVEALRKMRTHLQANGMLAIFFPGPMQGPGSGPAQGLMRTLEKAGYGVSVLATKTQGYGGRIVLGTRVPFSYRDFPPQGGLACAEELGISAYQPLALGIRRESERIFTDEFPMLETDFPARAPVRKYY